RLKVQHLSGHFLPTPPSLATMVAYGRIRNVPTRTPNFPMPNRTSKTGSELFIVDNSDSDWKVVRYLHDWCQISRGIDIATAYFEIGSLLALDGQWQKLDTIRVLMGDEISLRTKAAFDRGLTKIEAA